MSGATDNLIIGAGPYGLSLAAHLRARGANFRIVGDPMAPWRTAMPAGMYLKSEGFASTLYDPEERFTLQAYCSEHGLPYADTGVPIPVETFAAYGEAFQRHLVPELEKRMVARLERIEGGFRATCTDKGAIHARNVVVASGILHFSHIPEEFRSLPLTMASHSSDHHDLSCFKDRDVLVVGAGASAMDVAAALRLCGARAMVVARRPVVRFQTPLGDRSLLERLRAPMTPLGPGWKSVLCTKAPLLFHNMPDAFRSYVVERYLGPAPGWVTRKQVEGLMPILCGRTVLAASPRETRVAVTLRGSDDQTQNLVVDHVIAATGFRVSTRRIEFLDPGLCAAIAHVDGAPRLSQQFESSVPGLYFVGLTSANSFGPMMRFAAGARFAAQRLSRHLAAGKLGSKTTRATPNHQSALALDY